MGDGAVGARAGDGAVKGAYVRRDSWEDCSCERQDQWSGATGLSDPTLLFFLESAVAEFQGAAVFVDDADYVVGGAVGDFGFYLQCQPHLGAGEAG